VGQAVELEHSQAAGAQSVLVLLGTCVAVVLAAAAFMTMIVRGMEHQAAALSELSPPTHAPQALDLTSDASPTAQQSRQATRLH
jgi:hypothetical protein